MKLILDHPVSLENIPCVLGLYQCLTVESWHLSYLSNVCTYVYRLTPPQHRHTFQIKCLGECAPLNSGPEVRLQVMLSPYAWSVPSFTKRRTKCGAHFKRSPKNHLEFISDKLPCISPQIGANWWLFRNVCAGTKNMSKILFWGRTNFKKLLFIL